MTDRVRQWLVTAGAVFMIFGTLYGFGLIGTPVEQTSGGSLSAEATLLAPAVRAFSIWSVIYAGLIGYVVWQWLPANSASPRARRIGWLSAVSMALNGPRPLCPLAARPDARRPGMLTIWGDHDEHH